MLEQNKIWWLRVGLDVGFRVQLFQANDLVLQCLNPSLSLDIPLLELNNLFLLPGDQILLLNNELQQVW